MNQGEIVVARHFEGELYINGASYHQTIKAAVDAEREACAQLALQGTGEAVQTRTLEILQSERQRIAAAIRGRG